VPADLSAAPEIALLVAPYIPMPARRGDARPTIGSLARQLRLTARQPEQWWGRVRFGHLRCEKIELDMPGMWITVLAPGGEGMTCDCAALTVIAGTVMEEAVTAAGAVATTLVPGRIRVHGEGQVHQLRAAGDGYAVSLHARGSALRRTR
jgi:hypothetical protein